MGLGTVHGFRHPLGVLEASSVDKVGGQLLEGPGSQILRFG